MPSKLSWEDERVISNAIKELLRIICIIVKSLSKSGTLQNHFKNGYQIL